VIMKDINKLPTDGYLIFPLSMSRLQGDQSAKKCMEYLELLDEKVGVPGIDIVFLYTNGPYFNTEDLAYKVRKTTNKEMLSHKKALQKLIIRKKTYMPSAFHFLPFDYVVLNSDYFERFFDKLKIAKKKDRQFKRYLIEGLEGRKDNEANINFLLEEITASHIIREQLVEFPKSLAKKDSFRLIVYPGPVFKAESYVWQKKILPRNKLGRINKYNSSYYDPKSKILRWFDEMEV